MKVENKLQAIEQKWVIRSLGDEQGNEVNQLNVNFFYNLGSHLAPLTDISSAVDVDEIGVNP